MKRRGFLLGLLAAPFSPKILNSKEIVTKPVTFNEAAAAKGVRYLKAYGGSPLTVKLWSQRLYNEMMSEHMKQKEFVGLSPEMLGVKSTHDSYPSLSSEPHPPHDEDSQ